MNLSKKQKQTQTEKGLFAKGQGRGNEMDWELGVSGFKLLHLEQINSKVLMCSTGIYIESHGIDNDGK